MNYFRYKLIESMGRVSSGIIKLPYNEVLSATSHLEREGSTTIYVKKLGQLSSFLLNFSSFRFIKKVDRNFQAEFLGNVSMMLRSGVPLISALEEAAAGSDKPDFELYIKEIIFNIQSGASFSEAAEKYRHIFSDTSIQLIRLGEETGKLSETLMDASGHLKRIQKIISDTKQALIYPGFVFGVMGGGLLFWFWFVVPKIISLFTQMDVALPALTVFLIRLSSFVQHNIMAIILGLSIFILTIIFSYKKNRRFRKTTDIILLKLPISSSIISASNLAFITEYLSLLLNVGIDIIRSVEILESSIKNEVYREQLIEIMAGIKRGAGIAESFKKASIFPTFVVRMIHVGEQSGSLPEQLITIAKDYREKLSVLVASIGKIIEPVVIIIAGAMFAIIIGGLFLPIYDLVSTLSTR